MEPGPWMTQGYPLSLGEIIMPRRGDKSTEPAPYSPSITANLFYWYSNDLSAWMLSRQGKAFSDLLSPHSWLFSTFITLKYAW